MNSAELNGGCWPPAGGELLAWCEGAELERVRLSSKRDAEQVNPYRLAEMMAAYPMLPPGPATVVHELAVVSALAERLAGWVGLHIHQALLAGVPVGEIAEACGQDLAGVETTWRSWADNQCAHALVARSVYERAEARFREDPR